MKTTKALKQNGFTISEVLVATIILSIFLTSLLSITILLNKNETKWRSQNDTISDILNIKVFIATSLKQDAANLYVMPNKIKYGYNSAKVIEIKENLYDNKVNYELVNTNGNLSNRLRIRSLDFKFIPIYNNYGNVVMIKIEKTKNTNGVYSIIPVYINANRPCIIDNSTFTCRE